MNSIPVRLYYVQIGTKTRSEMIQFDSLVGAQEAYQAAKKNDEVIETHLYTDDEISL